MGDNVKKASDLFENKGCSCSQSVFAAFASDLGLDEDIALKIASSFGGGIGHQGEMCGVVTGAIMALGLKYGKNRKLTDEEKAFIDGKVDEFIKKFKEKNNYILCRELLGYNVGIPEEKQIIKENKITVEKCPDFVKDSANILENIIFGK